MYAQRSEDRLQESLAEVAALLEKLRVLEEFAHRQETERRDLIEQLQHRQNEALLGAKLRTLHPADLAYILEALPPDERRIVWRQVDVAQVGPVLVEVSEGIRNWLIEELPRRRLVEALRNLDPEDLGYLADYLADDVLQEVSRDLDAGERSWLQASITYDEESVGHLMTRDVATLREGQTVGEALADLRLRGALPEHTDRLFVADARNVLRGAVDLQAILVTDPEVRILDAMTANVLAFTPTDEAGEAAKAFERYNLGSAPVVDDRGKLIGRITVDEMIDFIRAQADREALKRAGLRREESLFSSVAESVRNRAPWLLINLMTAFVASRVIGFFEASIEQLVALATLMPIVASVGGNTGNQTVALVIRGLTLDQIQPANTGYLVRKELSVAVLNGLLWGAVMGLFADLIYGGVALGVVMMAAVVLNLALAALAGIAVPVALQRAGRDPAQGSSVLLTFITDSMGFFLFLGLATVFLV